MPEPSAPRSASRCFTGDAERGLPDRSAALGADRENDLGAAQEQPEPTTGHDQHEYDLVGVEQLGADLNWRRSWNSWAWSPMICWPTGYEQCTDQEQWPMLIVVIVSTSR